MARSPAQFVREVRQEMRRVIWPTRREVILSTVMVTIFVTITALFLTLTDQIVSTAIQALIGLGAL
ncbi:MAG: preprotein translocase subunit SecE [Alphaproteobacteria bacterium]|nr:preprotein translocase subunit SecE [Alphaproteobacteria bacterium]